MTLALLAVELWRGLRGRPRPLSIMDIGLLSRDMEGALAASLRVAGLFALFILVGTTAGMRWGALAFAIAGPIVLLRGLGRWVASAITLLIVFIFVWVFLDNILFIIYPKPFIAEWFRSRF